jgi:hypothetical protein
MPSIKVSNREGLPLVAEIYQDSELAGNTDTEGVLELPAGDYVAKVSGYDEKRFRVRNQATPNFVVLSSLSEINQSGSGLSKEFQQQDLIVLAFIGIAILTTLTIMAKSKKGKAKI